MCIHHIYDSTDAFGKLMKCVYPKVMKDIKELEGHCLTCQHYQHTRKQDTLLSCPPTIQPWEKVSKDIFTINDQNYLITGDNVSGYFEVHRLISKPISDIYYFYSNL